jgi:hypothetical protein
MHVLLDKEENPLFVFVFKFFISMNLSINECVILSSKTILINVNYLCITKFIEKTDFMIVCLCYHELSYFSFAIKSKTYLNVLLINENTTHQNFHLFYLLSKITYLICLVFSFLLVFLKYFRMKNGFFISDLSIFIHLFISQYQKS